MIKKHPYPLSLNARRTIVENPLPEEEKERAKRGEAERNRKLNSK